MEVHIPSSKGHFAFTKLTFKGKQQSSHVHLKALLALDLHFRGTYLMDAVNSQIYRFHGFQVIPLVSVLSAA